MCSDVPMATIRSATLTACLNVQTSGGIPLNSHTNGHACPFSIKLAQAVISAWSRPGDLVCDPYLGSGTTALAAIGLGRRFIGAERLEKYARQAELALERVA